MILERFRVSRFHFNENLCLDRDDLNSIALYFTAEKFSLTPSQSLASFFLFFCKPCTKFGIKAKVQQSLGCSPCLIEVQEAMEDKVNNVIYHRCKGWLNKYHVKSKNYGIGGHLKATTEVSKGNRGLSSKRWFWGWNRRYYGELIL